MNDTYMEYLDAYCNSFLHKESGFTDYLREIQIAEAWAGEDISSFDRKMAATYKEYLISSGLKATTISKKMRILSAFFTFLENKGVVNINPFFLSATGETYLKYNPRSLTEDETHIEQALSAIYQSERYNLYLFSILVYRLGCKMGYLLKLKVPDDIEFDGKRYAIILHNYPPLQMSRKIVLPLDMSESFGSFLNALTPGFLFRTKKGTAYDRFFISHTLTKYGISYQTLRVHAQVNLLKDGKSPDEVSYVAGTSGKWTKRYIAVAKDLGESVAD